MKNKIDNLYKKSSRLRIDDKTKIVIMSDCHRGAGDNFDNFTKNENIFIRALKYYYKKGFIYLELGDGDEMWEVNNYRYIIEEHADTFKIMKKYNDKKRLIVIYGNHDIEKKYSKTFQKYYLMFESLILNYKNKDILLFHGHQVDFINGPLWRLSRFLVKHIWRHLEQFGIKNPTVAGRNYKVKKRIERKFKKWSLKNNKIVITGHTHRPVYPKIRESLYFNSGSCIHPNGITCLEIDNGFITLVKWSYKLNQFSTINIKREVLMGKEKILKFYMNN